MTEDSKPTDNGIAERVNGTIKTEKIYRQQPYNNIEEARQDISEFIDFYNEKRPHMSIGYQTPNKAHQQTGPQEKKMERVDDKAILRGCSCSLWDLLLYIVWQLSTKIGKCLCF